MSRFLSSDFRPMAQRLWHIAALLLLGAGSVAHADPIIKLLKFQDTPDPVAATQTVNYDRQVSNTNFTLSTAGVGLLFPVPDGVSFVSVSDSACMFTAPNVLCSFGTVARPRVAAARSPTSMAQTSEFRAAAAEYRQYTFNWGDRWRSLMELFMAGGNLPVADPVLAPRFSSALAAELKEVR